jgi:hypothetical protein
MHGEIKESKPARIARGSARRIKPSKRLLTKNSFMSSAPVQ